MGELATLTVGANYPLSFSYLVSCINFRNTWILDRRRLDEAMREDLEYVDIGTLTKIKMWYYNSMWRLDTF